MPRKFLLDKKVVYESSLLRGWFFCHCFATEEFYLRLSSLSLKGMRREVRPVSIYNIFPGVSLYLKEGFPK